MTEGGRRPLRRVSTYFGMLSRSVGVGLRGIRDVSRVNFAAPPQAHRRDNHISRPLSARSCRIYENAWAPLIKTSPCRGSGRRVLAKISKPNRAPTFRARGRSYYLIADTMRKCGAPTDSYLPRPPIWTEITDPALKKHIRFSTSNRPSLVVFWVGSWCRVDFG